MVVYWYVKIECECGNTRMPRKPVAGMTLTSDELKIHQERYNDHCKYCRVCTNYPTVKYYTYEEDTADYAEPPSILQPQQQQPQQQQQQQQQRQMQQPPPSPTHGEFKLQLHYVPPPPGSPPAVQYVPPPPGSPPAENRLQFQQQQPQQQQTEETASLQQELLRQMVALQQQMMSLQQQVEVLTNNLSDRGAAGEAGAAQSTAPVACEWWESRVTRSDDRGGSWPASSSGW